MDILKYKEYEGTAELDMSRMVCRGKILFIDDLVTYEASRLEDLQKEFEAAVDDYLETCLEIGKEPQRPLRGLFNVRVTPELHRAAVLRATADGVSLNEVVVRAIDAFVNARTEVKHDIRITVEGLDEGVKTVTSTASDQTQWDVAYAH